MKGGFNKILRNIVAGSADTEYEKRLTKATFHMDSKEPKEKHVIYLLESLNGEHKDQVSPIGALKFILERHISNLDNWAITTKVFIILHRALQNKRVNRKVIKDLKKNEHLLHPYQKKNPDNKYNIRMFMEISKQYSVYIKYYMNTCNKTDIMTKARKGFSEEVRKLKMSEILKNYEYFEGLSTQIFDLFQHTNFCKQSRLFSNLIFMLLKDLMEIYRIYYTHITEILERFPSLGKREAQKAFVMYQNFVNLTEAIKNKANKLIYIFNFPITLPDFYNPERGLIDTLRVVVSSAGEEASTNPDAKINQISSKLRSGMNKEQFEEEKKGEDLDAIQNVYFDCNALDRIDEQPSKASVPASVADPSEELKMDKDLGLFEMINAGDFSTVTANPGAAAAATSAEGQNGEKSSNTFNFDQYNGAAAAAQPEGQSADDFFNFASDGNQAAAASQPAATAPPQTNITEDLFDVFSSNVPSEPAAGNETNNKVDPLSDIFAQGSQPLAPKVQDIPSNDKYSQFNALYQQQSAGGAQQPQPNQFQTQSLPGTDPFSQLMNAGAQQPTNSQNPFNSMPQQQPASGFQPMMGGFATQQQPNPMNMMGGAPPQQQQMMAMQQQMAMMGMNTNQPMQQRPAGQNPFDNFQVPPQQQPMGNAFGTAPVQQQQQPAPGQQQQQQDPFAFNF